MSIRDKRKGAILEHHVRDQNITTKEFGEEDNNGKDSVMWKNREKDWYNAERRFVFAAIDSKKRD